MAATIQSRPVWVRETIDENKTFPCILKLHNCLGFHLRPSLVKMAHIAIHKARTLVELGYSSKAYIPLPGGRFKGVMDVNPFNYELSMKILEFDQGVFAHLMNKASLLMKKRIITMNDHLGIMDFRYRSPCDEVMNVSLDEDTEMMYEDCPVYLASLRYGSWVLGE